MKLVIKNSTVFASHEDSLDLTGLYAGAEVIRVTPDTAALLSTENGDAPTDPRTTGAYTIADVRYDRDARLASCDWTQSADSPLTSTQKANWATYRQALRDLPQDAGVVADPSSVTWPTEPAA